VCVSLGDEITCFLPFRYVGKLPLEEQLTDERVKEVLGVFGRVLQWKRASDPSSGNLKGFGFCTFDSPDAVLKALRVLNDYQMQGWEKGILVKTDKKTTEQLEQYKAKNPEDSSGDSQLKATVDGICLGTNPTSTETVAPTNAQQAMPGQPKQFQTEIEKFREAQAARDQELEKKRRARLQERVDSAKKREKEMAEKAMEQKVEQELDKLKQASEQSGASPDSRARRERSRSRDRDRDRRDRDRRSDRDRDRRSDRDRRDRDRRGREKDEDPQEYRFDGGEDGETGDYDPMAASQQTMGESAAAAIVAPAPETAAAAAAAASSAVSTTTTVPAARAPVSLAPVKVSLGFAGSAKKKDTKPKTAANLGMFGVPEEEESKKKKMTLVPLDYTEVSTEN
jgi:RNA recognition motif-containing protein